MQEVKITIIGEGNSNNVTEFKGEGKEHFKAAIEYLAKFAGLEIVNAEDEPNAPAVDDTVSSTEEEEIVVENDENLPEGEGGGQLASPEDDTGKTGSPEDESKKKD